MQLFYNPQITLESTRFTLNREESKHVVKVLRKKEGDQIHITDGKGNLFYGTLMMAHSNKCELSIAFAKAESPLPYQLHIAIAPTKMNDRMEWFLEKATEMGITKVTPLLCDHSERKKINVERYQRILVSAMKQSLQFHLPELAPLTSFKDFVTTELQGTKLIAHCEDQDKTALSSMVKAGTSTTILIGPEGDFSTTEITTAISNGFHPTALGNSRLRTETAGVYCAAVVNQLNAISE